ncbi:MAG: hypothetical protein GF411_04065 [Candidatus Lokiarchaeota archaeon]|nr:hypothetical protein [Candidatus Lokiarchaeota archaeon]
MSAIKNLTIIMLTGTVVLLSIFFMTLNRLDSIQDDYIVHQEQSSEYVVNSSLILVGNHSYKILVEFRQHGVFVAEVDGNVTLLLNDTKISTVNMFDRDTGDEDSDSYAYSKLEHSFDSQYEVNVTVSGKFIQGDSWSITIYQDLPEGETHDEIQLENILLLTINSMILLTLFTVIPTIYIIIRENWKTKEDNSEERYRRETVSNFGE